MAWQDKLRPLLALYYEKIREVGRALLIPEHVYLAEAVHLRAAKWIATEKLSPPAGSKTSPIYRVTLTRLGAREGDLALRARDGD